MKRIIIILCAAALVSCAGRHAQEARQVGAVVRDTINGVPCQVYVPHGSLVIGDRSLVSGDRALVIGVRYPVLYLQHGMFGNENDWVEQGHLVHWMDSLLRIDAVKEMVVVMPDNCPSRPTYEEEKDNATTGEWEAHFAEFMADTERKYPVRSDAAGRAIAGLSMGGYHTMRVAATYPGQFAYVGMFSPATFVHEAPTGARVFWIGIGNEDFLFESLQEYRAWLDASHIEYTYYESTGGHTWPNWQDYICRFLPKLFKELAYGQTRIT